MTSLAGSTGQPLSLWRRLLRLRRLILKELRETLRDRRTILTLFLMPLLLYPLIAVGFQRFLLSGLSSLRDDQQRVFRVGVLSEGDAQSFQAWLALARQGELAEGRPQQTQPRIELYQAVDVEQELRDFTVDVVVRPQSNFALPARRELAVDLEFVFLDVNQTGIDAVEFLQQRLAEANRIFLADRLHDAGMLQRSEPVRVRQHSLKGEARPDRLTLAAVLPVILILMTMTGAVYPAIDLTAGERERNTLETLMAAPVPALGVLFAKYCAVWTVASLTATINLTCMTITLLSSGLAQVLLGPQGLTLVGLLTIFFLLLLMAAFFSAVVLCVTSVARSFKEAQAYLIPLMLLAITPGVMSLVPGLKLAGGLIFVPLLNIALLSRDLLEGHPHPGATLIVVLSTLLYALAAISLAARIFGTDAVLSEVHTTWSDTFKRRPVPQPVASVSLAMLCLAIMFPLYFVASNFVGRLAAVSVAGRLLYTGLATIVIFAGVPTLAVWLGRIRLSTGLQFRVPMSAVAWLGAALLGVSLWPFAAEITLLLRQFGIVTLRAEQLELVKGLLQETSQLPLPILLLTFAVIPASCEEFFFRGFLQSALLTRLKPARAICTSAILFGLFHLVVTEGLAFERLAPSTLMGLVLGWVCWRTGSVFPGMLLHGVHNGLLVVGSRYPDFLEHLGLSGADDSHFPLTWLAGAGLLALTGAFLVHLSRSRGVEAKEL